MIGKLVFILLISTPVFSYPPEIPDGEENRSGIKNGKPVKPCHKYPFHVMVKGVKKCGGSLITYKTVLTAAHCLTKGETLDVYVGAYVNPEGGNEFYPVTPKCNTTGEKLIGTALVDEKHHKDSYDFGLVILKKKPKITKHVGLICLPPPDFKYKPGVKAIGIGWGNVNVGHDLKTPNVLMETGIKLINDNKCERAYHHDFDAESMVCASSNKHDVCHGDSGGSLFVCMKTEDGTRVPVNIGIVSFGDFCDEDDPKPGVYSKTSANLEWIRENMVGKEDQRCKEL